MAFISNSDLNQFSCGDVVPGSTGMLTLAFGPGSSDFSGAPDKMGNYPFWFGWYKCKEGEELKLFENSETYVAYHITEGKFKILSEGETKEVGPGDWVGFPPKTKYEVEALENNSVLLWVYVPPKAG